jgi:predicted  nucleic acid-binding Zn-ribbon protein
MGTRSLDEMTTPTRKLLAFFQRSRDGWKEKYLALKDRAVLLSNQVYAVEKSRDTWRARAKDAERQLAELQSPKKVSQRQPAVLS